MVNQTAFNFPLAPDAAVEAELAVTIGSGAPVYTLHGVTGGALPEPFALGVLDDGASVSLVLRWYDAGGAQIGDALTATFTLPSGPDSPLGLTITTRPSPVVPT